VRLHTFDGLLQQSYIEKVLFELQAECPDTGARAGLTHTAHGVIETPSVFMPVGTQDREGTRGTRGQFMTASVFPRIPCIPFFTLVSRTRANSGIANWR